jgi:hypothetical protein
MSEITVWSPLGINRVAARPLTPRLASLDGVTLGILNNSKPNSLRLQEQVVERLARTIEGDGAIEGAPGPPARGRV